MWIGNIDVPEAVLDAAEAGNLVLFVGAGASRGSPSDLPDFAKLVRDIGTVAGRVPTQEDVRQPDVFLGRLEDTGVDVHSLVASAIDKPGSQENSLHTVIVGLAAACQSPRIVTTNYDRHLSTAAAAASYELKVYEAPALPMGDDFEGIVHLHGSLSQPGRRLVVTDTDFGRAYLREAWAARFLERMFAKFTVVFIGYSHGDVVMQYLARSLGPDQSRYVLTDDDQNAEWRRLGLKPIAYPNDTGDHSTLPASIERWRVLATMKHVEHRARIASLVAVEPPTIPEEVSYVEAAISHPERIRYFTDTAKFNDAARAERWFTWIEVRGAFLALFSDGSASEPAHRVLLSWIADEYILSEERSGRVLRAFSEKPWPPDTWREIARALLTFEGAFPSWLSPWLQLVVQHAPSSHEPLLDMMLVEKDWSNNIDLALLVFEDRTRPVLKRALDLGGATDQPRFEVDLCGDEHWLTDSWTKIFLPVLGRCFEQVLSLATEQLSRAYRIRRALNLSGTFDAVSFSRSAIKQHQQDSHRNPIDALIDAARDSIEAALADAIPIGVAYLEMWAASPNTILRRLAMHGWRVRTDVGSDDKVTWLLDQDLLWESPLQHEVFQLVRETLPAASPDVAKRLVDTAVVGPPAGPGDEYAPYRSYNLLGWLSVSAPELDLAAAAFDAAQEAHPEYERREHPDLNSYSESGVVENAPPFSAVELHEMVSEDPSAALAGLREFQATTHALKGPTWTGALRSLQACVTTNPNDGVRIAEVLLAEDADLRSSLIYGWDGAALTDDQTEQVLTIISGWDMEEIRRPVSSMLSNGGSPEHPTAWHALSSARKLASALWPTAPTSGAIVSGADVVMEAINHPAGDLAEFWTKVVQWEWSQATESWVGIPAEIAAELDRMTEADDRNGLLARAMLASQLHFFFGADRDWCVTRLLPRFDWADVGEATAAWQGFLTWGRWNDGLLQEGLIDSYLSTSEHIAELPNRLGQQLAAHLSSIAMFAAVEPTTWLTDFVLRAPEDLRVYWANHVAHALTQLRPAEAPAQWDRWIHSYWSARNQSVPQPFTSTEASATASWVVGLPGVRSHAVDFVLASIAGLDQHGGLLGRLSDIDLAAEASDWVRLLTHLLKNTTQQPWGLGHDLQPIVLRLRQGTPSPDLSDLVNEAMRLGATDADDW